MIKVLAFFVALVTSTSAFALTGGGSVACSSPMGEYVGVFNIVQNGKTAYTSATVFEKQATGKFVQYDARNRENFAQVNVKVGNGKTIVVEFDGSGCFLMQK